MTYLELFLVIFYCIGIDALAWRKALIDPELLFGPPDVPEVTKRSNVTIPQLNLSVSLNSECIQGWLLYHECAHMLSKHTISA